MEVYNSGIKEEAIPRLVEGMKHGTHVADKIWEGHLYRRGTPEE